MDSRKKYEERTEEKEKQRDIDEEKALLERAAKREMKEKAQMETENRNEARRLKVEKVREANAVQMRKEQERLSKNEEHKQHTRRWAFKKQHLQDTHQKLHEPDQTAAEKEDAGESMSKQEQIQQQQEMSVATQQKARFLPLKTCTGCNIHFVVFRRLFEQAPRG